MKITDRLKIIGSAFSKQSSQSLSNITRRFMPTLGEPPKRSTEEWMKLYSKSPRMNPIHQIASDVATSIYGIYNDGDTKKIKQRNNPASLLLKNPCPDQTVTEYALFYITQVYLLLPAGEAFWLKERNGLGKVTELWPIPPHWVSEIPSQSKPFFTVQPQGNMQAQSIYVTTNDMVYFKKPDIVNPYLRGAGRAEQIGDEIETDEYMAKHAKRYFFNNAIPPMVGMMPGADEPTINRQKEKWQQDYGGYNNAHKVGWLNWDAKFQILKETAKDMDFIASRKYLRDVSNQHFNIPPELFGILENSNRSTIDAAYFLYTKNVLRKELKFIDDTLNIQLIPEFSKTIYIEHDNIVPEDKEFELKKATEGLKNGALKVNLWLRANGYEEIGEKGEILYVPLNMMPVPLNKNALEVNMEPQQQEMPTTEPKEVKKKIEIDQKEQIWHVLDKAAMKNERPFINALKRYFQDQQNKINDSLQKAIKQATNNPDDLLDWDEETIILLGIMTPLWLQSLNEGFETVNATFNFGLSENMLQPKFLEWIDKFGAEQVKNINNTTKEKLRKTLSEGIAEGESIPKLRDRVSTIMTEAKISRAEKIARTETHNTVSVGTHETYKAANAQRRSWLTSIDGRERESHAAINGEIRGIDQPFSNGLMYPGDANGDASELVNCRCVEIPELE